MLNSKFRIRIAVAILVGWFYLPAQAVTADIPPAPAAMEKLEQPDAATPERSQLGITKRDLTLLQVEEIQGETVIAEAKVILAKARKALSENGSMAVTETSIGTSAIPVSATSPALSAAAHNQLPQINEIYGGGKSLIARLVLSDGSYAELTEGQHIPGTKLKITSISAREVRVSGVEGGTIQSLPFN